jgi:hypothetical protein
MAARLAEARGHADTHANTVRVFAPLLGESSESSTSSKSLAERELALLQGLQLAHSTISVPASDAWRVEHGTAVLRATEQVDIGAAVSGWISELDKDAPWSQIVVIIETREAREWDDSYECAYNGASITLTSYYGGFFGALVYAPTSVVLVDYERDVFYSCTLVGEATPPYCQSLDAPGHGDELEILKADYCAGTKGSSLRAESMYLCHRKVLAFARAEKRRIAEAGTGTPHEIESGGFRRVFVTSDIHADLRKFVQILRACGLITIGDYKREEIYAVHKTGESSGEQKIYDLVWDAKWAAEDTMLVICGDLVDGVGTGDSRGSYEFLLHCLLFNLRIQARRMGSEVRFTIGNHDAGTVTGFPPYGLGNGPYVDPKHGYFAPSGCSVGLAVKRGNDNGGRYYDLYARRDMLLPFYACSPYIMLTFGKVAFVHAGFVDKSRVGGVYADALKRQTQLDDAPLEADTDLVEFFAPTRPEAYARADTPYVLWSRGYAVLDHEGACDAENEAHKRFELIAVGHCVTHLYLNGESGLEQVGRAQCADITGAQGCVITRDCSVGKARTAPLIALVDTGMSAAFRGPNESNESRGVGMLLLAEEKRTTVELRVVDKYYVYRIRALNGMSALGPAGNEEDPEMPESVSARFGMRCRPYI